MAEHEYAAPAPVKVTTRQKGLASRERAKRAVELALAGMTRAQISEQLGWKTPAAATKAIARALAEGYEVDAGRVEELRQAELARLDRLHQAHWMNALRGDHRASDMILRISDRRSRLLGLDQPVKVEQIVTTQLDAEIEHLLALMPKPDDRKEIP